jgi:hypothetical protein
VGNNGNELRLEQFVPIEEKVITKPCTRGRQKTASKMRKCKAKRFGIITSDIRSLLGDLQLMACQRHLVGAMVNKPRGTNSGYGEGNSEDILSYSRFVRAIAVSAIENEKQ